MPASSGSQGAHVGSNASNAAADLLRGPHRPPQRKGPIRDLPPTSIGAPAGSPKLHRRNSAPCVSRSGISGTSQRRSTESRSSLLLLWDSECVKPRTQDDVDEALYGIFSQLMTIYPSRFRVELRATQPLATRGGLEGAKEGDGEDRDSPLPPQNQTISRPTLAYGWPYVDEAAHVSVVVTSVQVLSNTHYLAPSPSPRPACAQGAKNLGRDG
ncbi:hypothetical protein BDK51DRAFT_40785 [Blyttiomyces helicus]|uniref:Uncharacterized protein n=1 Tax=Blyttiomyces helicus TaxID=388810 RepID=A0A4P9WDN2_9FUNG|nr:hypothetical protein BDK51DRAFT_40785 [Blyttiomyces helicus]|eukprot:RKO89783.1 hypothetical protein BDK51DRAFT_40785 [Blyttiomyces helicus]